MRAFLSTSLVLSMLMGVAAQAPVQTIKDGVLDKIELHVASLEKPGQLVVVIKPFDSSGADLGTGGKDGKETRQQEAQTMQSEGPRVLSERFVATLQGGPFKGAQVLKADEAVPDGAIVVEGRFVTMDPGSRAKRYFAGFGAGKSAVAVDRHCQGRLGQDARALRAAAHRRDGHGRRRFAGQADERFTQHRRGRRQVPDDVGQGREPQGLTVATTFAAGSPATVATAGRRWRRLGGE